MTETLNKAVDDPSDAVLITAVRAGDMAAYGVLYQRHLDAARRAASSLVATVTERDDLIAEAFTRVLRALRDGWGPSTEFRPYLLVALRNTAINAGQRTPLVALYDELPDALLARVAEDPVDEQIQAGVAATAFARLPQRWQTVLWRTEIEGEPPAALAPHLGMTANGVAALAYRAREGLRQAYLEQHLPTPRHRGCRTTVDQLAGWIRRGMPRDRSKRITAHLEGCPDCRRLATGLAQLNSNLPAITAALIVGAAAVSGFTPSATAALTTSGVVTTSWLTTVKVIVAGATLTTATAITATASDPARQSPANLAIPATAQPTASAPGNAATPTTRPLPQSTPTPFLFPGHPDTSTKRNSAEKGTTKPDKDHSANAPQVKPKHTRTEPNPPHGHPATNKPAKANQGQERTASNPGAHHKKVMQFQAFPHSSLGEAGDGWVSASRAVLVQVWRPVRWRASPRQVAMTPRRRKSG